MGRSQRWSRTTKADWALLQVGWPYTSMQLPRPTRPMVAQSPRRVNRNPPGGQSALFLRVGMRSSWLSLRPLSFAQGPLAQENSAGGFPVDLAVQPFQTDVFKVLKQDALRILLEFGDGKTDALDALLLPIRQELIADVVPAVREVAAGRIHLGRGRGGLSSQQSVCLDQEDMAITRSLCQHAVLENLDPPSQVAVRIRLRERHS